MQGHKLSPCVAQPRRNAVDGNMNATLLAVIGFARPVAAHQLHLQVLSAVRNWNVSIGVAYKV